MDIAEVQQGTDKFGNARAKGSEGPVFLIGSRKLRFSPGTKVPYSLYGSTRGDNRVLFVNCFGRVDGALHDSATGRTLFYGRFSERYTGEYPLLGSKKRGDLGIRGSSYIETAPQVYCFGAENPDLYLLKDLFGIPESVIDMARALEIEDISAPGFGSLKVGDLARIIQPRLTGLLRAENEIEKETEFALRRARERRSRMFL